VKVAVLVACMTLSVVEAEACFCLTIICASSFFIWLGAFSVEEVCANLICGRPFVLRSLPLPPAVYDLLFFFFFFFHFFFSAARVYLNGSPFLLQAICCAGPLAPV